MGVHVHVVLASRWQEPRQARIGRWPEAREGRELMSSVYSIKTEFVRTPAGSTPIYRILEEGVDMGFVMLSRIEAEHKISRLKKADKLLFEREAS
jgi:hypothetical protein